MKLRIKENCLNESKILNPFPTKGYSIGYTGTIKIKPGPNCNGIPEDILEYIRYIENYDKKSKIVNYTVNNGELYAMIKVPELTIECQFILPTEQDEYDKFVNKLRDAGWIVED